MNQQEQTNKLPEPEIDTSNNGQPDSNIADTPIEQQADTDNNGIVSPEERFQFEERPLGNQRLIDNTIEDLGYTYENEDAIKKYIPNYQSYKWYKDTSGDFYSLGEWIEDAIESNPEKSIEMAEQVIEETPLTEKDVQPIIEEAKQIIDSDKRNDEVSNETIEDTAEKIEKKIGSFMPDIPTKEISQKEYDDMSIDEIEKADEAAMKGNGDYITVAKDLDIDENDLYYFEDPSFLASLTDKQKEQIKNEPDKKKKLDLLKFFGMKANPNLENGGSLSSEESNISNEEKPITSSVNVSTPTIGGGGSSINVSSSMPTIENQSLETANSNAAGGNIDISVAERDSNEGSQNGANINKALDDSFDSLSFKETPHEKNIKTNDQFKLNGKEGHTTNSNKGVELKLPKDASKNDIKKALLENSRNWDGNDSKGRFLPFRFIINGNDIIVSQIGTARKLPFDEFVKKEPGAIQQLKILLGSYLIK